VTEKIGEDGLNKSQRSYRRIKADPQRYAKLLQGNRRRAKRYREIPTNREKMKLQARDSKRRQRLNPEYVKKERERRRTYYHKYKNDPAHRETIRRCHKNWYESVKGTPRYKTQVKKWSETAYRKRSKDPVWMEKQRKRSLQQYYELSSNPDVLARRRAYQKAHREKMKKDPEWVKKQRRATCESAKRTNREFRRQFLEMYGNRCMCCGETDRILLTLDHVKNDGKHERSEGGSKQRLSYKRATQRYDPERYQILCYNCNIGKARNNGVCPHKTRKVN
jgi:hypothetical protein